MTWGSTGRAEWFPIAYPPLGGTIVNRLSRGWFNGVLERRSDSGSRLHTRCRRRHGLQPFSHARHAGMVRPMRLDPLSFAFEETFGRFVVRVRFRIADDAVAFAERFAGRLL